MVDATYEDYQDLTWKLSLASERIRDLEKHLSVQDAYIDTLEAENARLRAEVERLEDRLNDEVSFDDDDIYDGVKTDTTGVSRYEILLLTTIFIGVLMSIYGVAQIG